MRELWAAHGQRLYSFALRLAGSAAQAAAGHVWTLTCAGLERPNHDLTIGSMLHLAEGIQYRLVGSSAADYACAQAGQPGLEDGYVWLMRRAGQAVEALQVP